MPVVVQVFSDYNCPYCYLGEVALQKAAADTGATIVHRAYQLRESGPPKFEPRSERMNAAWESSILPMAKELGVEIHQPSRSPLTRLAHEAAEWAGRHGRFDEFRRQLYKAFFLEDKDISNLPVLKELAWKVGLNPTELETALTSGQMAEEVEEDLMIARTYNITVVPSLVIAGHVISGLQTVEILSNLISLANEGKLNVEIRNSSPTLVNISRQ